MSAHKNSAEAPMLVYGGCSYPSCRQRKIETDSPFVSWHGLRITPEQLHDNLSPMAKLVVVANPSEYAERFGEYSFNIELHPECAAEWGMQLIKDALTADLNVGRKLRGT